MLTLSTAGKSGSEAVNLVRDALSKSDEDEVKILIDGPAQAESIKKFLGSLGFNNVVPEDDEGTLYLMASKTHEEPQQKIQARNSAPPEKNFTPSSTGILISCKSGEYNQAFYKKFLASLIQAQNKPDIIAFIDSAVKLAGYNSKTCGFLKKLEAEGVQVLISESCADRLGITEAIGAGVVVDMSEIIDEIFACEKVISV